MSFVCYVWDIPIWMCSSSLLAVGARTKCKIFRISLLYFSLILILVYNFKVLKIFLYLRLSSHVAFSFSAHCTRLSFQFLILCSFHLIFHFFRRLFCERGVGKKWKFVHLHINKFSVYSVELCVCLYLFSRWRKWNFINSNLISIFMSWK